MAADHAGNTGNSTQPQLTGRGSRVSVSTSAVSALGPAWRRDGNELYYVSADQKLMVLPIKLGSGVEPGTPQTLFSVPGITGHAPFRDGQRFLVNGYRMQRLSIARILSQIRNWS